MQEWLAGLADAGVLLDFRVRFQGQDWVPGFGELSPGALWLVARIMVCLRT